MKYLLMTIGLTKIVFTAFVLLTLSGCGGGGGGGDPGTSVTDTSEDNITPPTSSTSLEANAAPDNFNFSNYYNKTYRFTPDTSFIGSRRFVIVTDNEKNILFQGEVTDITTVILNLNLKFSTTSVSYLLYTDSPADPIVEGKLL